MEALLMKYPRLVLLPTALLVLMALAVSSADGGKASRVLLVCDVQTQGPSDTVADLKRILTDSGRFALRVCEAPEALSAASLANFDLVVLNTPLAPGSETERTLAAWVATGKGLLVARGGLAISGVPGPWPLSAGKGGPTPVRFLDVRLANTSHPIVRGMDESFRTVDGLPGALQLHPDADAVAAVEIDGSRVPVLATTAHGSGRIACLALGANASALHGPKVRALFARSAEWAATGAVTLPAVLEPNGHAAGAVKGLLITGGHEHEAAFYSLFTDDPDIDWLPVDSAASAFQRDLRQKYDVVIFYDFTRDLDETAKSNLRAFVESGKGVVVLHHALLNYQTWSWWSEEVVGGRYRLQTEGRFPSSSVKDHQTMEMTPAAEHPVLKGIGPFQIVDEAYKNMFQSPRIKPLLVTDHPASDSTLAWIGPGDSFRVIAIQLGHGHSAFGHPAYRALVHNAVVWAAGRAP
jgi:type 1 glutamine amidotransferase